MSWGRGKKRYKLLCLMKWSFWVHCQGFLGKAGPTHWSIMVPSKPWHYNEICKSMWEYKLWYLQGFWGENIPYINICASRIFKNRYKINLWMLIWTILLLVTISWKSLFVFFFSFYILSKWSSILQKVTTI